jgi:dTDP-glucose 4,6-dehydratase
VVIDITQSRELLKWEPKVDLDEGLLRTIEWYRAEAGSAAK